VTHRIGDASESVSLPRRPLLIYWLIAVGIEFVLAAVFVLTGADAAIETALHKAGLDFATDFITAGRAVIAYPAATVGVVLSLLQVAAPDLAVLGVSVIRGGRALRRAVTGRFRFWSRQVGARRGLAIWAAMIVTFTACNLVSGLLHQRLVGGEFTWELGWRTLALLPVAMFLDAGAVLEENGWRGYSMPVALRRWGPLGASLVVGLMWAAWHYPVKFNVFLDYGAVGGSAVLGAFTLKLIAISVVMTFFWARAGQATILAIAMHGLSNDVARVGGLTGPLTWQTEVVTELDLAVPFIVVAIAVVLIARQRGWGDLRAIPESEAADAPGKTTALGGIA
jgi:membrane protease YdiL (CAAX protease family)